MLAYLLVSLGVIAAFVAGRAPVPWFADGCASAIRRGCLIGSSSIVVVVVADPNALPNAPDQAELIALAGICVVIVWRPVEGEARTAAEKASTMPHATQVGAALDEPLAALSALDKALAAAWCCESAGRCAAGKAARSWAAGEATSAAPAHAAHASTPAGGHAHASTPAAPAHASTSAATAGANSATAVTASALRVGQRGEGRGQSQGDPDG